MNQNSFTLKDNPRAGSYGVTLKHSDQGWTNYLWVLAISPRD